MRALCIQEDSRSPGQLLGMSFTRAQLSGVCFAERASPWCWYKRGFQSKCLHAEPRDKVVGVGRALAASASVSARTHSPELLPEPVSPARSSPSL